MSKYATKELTEVAVFLAKFASTVKLAVDDDGKITLGDALKFSGLVFPLVTAVTGIEVVPKEAADLDPVEREELLAAIRENLELAGNDEEAVEALLLTIFSLFEFLKIVGAIKPTV